MPTKLERRTINIPAELYEMIERDAVNNQRPLANQIIWCMSQYYAKRKEDADLFNPTQLHEGKQSAGVPVYETPPVDQRKIAQASKLRGQIGQE